MHIYISATMPQRHEVECAGPMWMSWVAGWSVRMSPWTPGLIDFKGPHPKLPA